MTLFRLGPEGRHVVYRAGGFSQRLWFAAALEGSPSPFQLPRQPLDGVEFSPDETRVVVRSNVNARIDLYSISLERRSWVKLTNNPWGLGFNVQIAAE